LERQADAYMTASQGIATRCEPLKTATPFVELRPTVSDIVKLDSQGNECSRISSNLHFYGLELPNSRHRFGFCVLSGREMPPYESHQ